MLIFLLLIPALWSYYKLKNTWAFVGDDIDLIDNIVSSRTWLDSPSKPLKKSCYVSISDMKRKTELPPSLLDL